MAPSRTPRRAKVQEHWENIGVRGRKTGVMLKPGLRDEHGLENIEGIFSSPEKSPARQNRLSQISTISEGESMDIGQSTIPDPTEVVGRVRNGKTLLPPRSRSPIKTNIGSSPRRSMGPMSSPSRIMNGATPTRAMSHQPNSSTLEISRGEVSPSIEGSNMKGRNSYLKRVKKPIFNGKGKKRTFDLSLADDSDDDEGNLTVANGVNEANESGYNNSGLTDNVDAAPPMRGRGRPSKKAKKDAYNDENMDPQTESSTAAATAAAPTNEETEPASLKKRKGSKPSTSERESNAKMKPPPRPRQKSNVTKPKYMDGAKSKSRSIITVRSETPAEDNGARVLKTGRTSVKPVAFWRNEYIRYDRGNLDGKILTLPGIKEIIRTEEIIVPRPKRPAGRGSRPKQYQRDDTEEKEERELWETETGIVRAQVMQWDPIVGKYDEETTEETEVAYASEAIQMRDISGAEFRFAKTLTLPFFGSGMVDLPPGGAKRVKNSRKMQMVFFVFYGRVTVDIGTPTTSFSIGKGGVWQVPRGNFYSITNNSLTNPARIFFAQGCEVNPETNFEEGTTA